MNVRHVKYSSFSGFVIRGTQHWNFLNESSQNKSLHIRRALWLSAKVENNATFGTIQSYDGCGMSGGLEHQVSVYPRNLSAQGTLFKTISSFPDAATEKLTAELSSVNWEIDKSSGLLVNKATRKTIPGNEIRDEFTPVDGVVPATGPFHNHAKKWAVIFAELFADPRTYESQIQAGLVRTGALDSIERSAYAARLGRDKFHANQLVVGSDLTADDDLALCVYHCFKVNAPSVAKTCLKSTVPYGENLWSRRLVGTISIKQYGNWDKRYNTTRRIAMASGLWPVELFGKAGIMPDMSEVRSG